MIAGQVVDNREQLKRLKFTSMWILSKLRQELLSAHIAGLSIATGSESIIDHLTYMLDVSKSISEISDDILDMTSSIEHLAKIPSRKS